MSFCDRCETLTINGVPTHEDGCPNAWFDPDIVSLSDDGTLDTVITVGNREIRYSQEFAAAYREDSGDFDMSAFIRDNFEELSDECFAAVEDCLAQISDWSEEYNTSHTDAGDAYAHMVSECWTECRQRLMDYIRENIEDVSGADIERLSDLDCNDWPFDMRPGHIFTRSFNDGCILDSWPVREIEEQIELSHIEEQTGLTQGMISHILREQRLHCVRMFRPTDDCCYLYINTDAVWFAVVDDSVIEDNLTDLA